MAVLTEKALNQILSKGIKLETLILQYLGCRSMATSSTSSTPKFRMLLNDGFEKTPFAMLNQSLNHLITDHILTEFSIIKIKQYDVKTVKTGNEDRNIIMVQDLEVLQLGEEIREQLKFKSEDQSKNHPPCQPANTSSSNNVVPAIQLNSTISGDVSVTPIAALSPYQNKWVIKVRVTNKSDKRTWRNERGEGTLFSMDLLDESGEIRCTAFKDTCEKYYDMIEVGKIYYISRCTLKQANKRFSSLKNDYELSMNNESEVVLCEEESDIPTIVFAFQPISSIETKEKDDLMDVLGVVKSCGDLITLTARTTGRELKKRDVNIVDESNAMVCLTLWGKQAEDFNGEHHPIVAVKGAKIGEFQGGRSLSILQSSVMQIDPDLPEAHKLRGWYSTVGEHEESKFISKSAGGGGAINGPWLTFKDAMDQGLGHKDVADVYVCMATITSIRNENILYKSCPSESCKKKVVDLSNQTYRCEKCDKEYPNFTYRILANMNLSDWSSNQFTTAFNEEAEKILGVSAQELGELKDNDNDLFLAKISGAIFKPFIFKLRVRLENYNDESRLKTTIAAVQRPNLKVYNAHLLAKIKELTNIGKA